MKFDSPRADEWPLVFDAWASSFRKSPWAGCVPNHLWDQVSRAAATEIIDRGARVLCAVADLPDGNRRVMGYAVAEGPILHWLFVKRDYRGMGVGRALLAEIMAGVGDSVEKSYTHRTRSSSRFLGQGWKWDPTSARIKLVK